MHERRRAAAVEVDRLACAERDHQPSQLAQLEAGVDARSAPVATDREQLAVSHPEPATRVAPDADVRVELRRAGREALLVGPVDDRAPVVDEQRAGLDQVTRRVGAERLPGREPDRDIYLACNSWSGPLDFRIPRAPSGRPWRRVIDTALPSPQDICEEGEGPVVPPLRRYPLAPHSLVVLVSEG